MSWGNGAIMTLDEVTKGAEAMPSEFQIGEPVGFWIEDGDKAIMIECFIVAVGIMNMHKVRYDLAFPVAGTPYYMVMKDVRGRITHRTAKAPVDLVDDPKQQLPAKPIRAALSLVSVPKTPSPEKAE